MSYAEEKLLMEYNELVQEKNNLESQLTAEREARQKAEDGLLKVNSLAEEFERKYYLTLDRTEAAEARIKASQGQEPDFMLCGDGHWIRAEDYPDRPDKRRFNEVAYRKPIIPPEVAELVGWCPVCNTVRMSLPKPAEGSCSHCFNHLMKLASAYDLQELQRENAELTRKLAEQQSLSVSILGRLRCYSFDEAESFVTSDGTKELTKLIEEAKRQAVPEWWKLVPIEPEK